MKDTTNITRYTTGPDGEAFRTRWAGRPFTEAEAAALAAAEAGDEAPLRALQAEARGNLKCGSLHTSHGLPCLRNRVPGLTTCYTHGARLPQNIAKAEKLLAVARLPSIEALLIILDQFNQTAQCHECGFPNHSVDEKRMVERVARTVLDRTGLGPKATLEVKTPEAAGALDVSAMNAGELAELDTLLASMEALKKRVMSRLAREARAAASLAISAEVVDAEVAEVPQPAPAARASDDALPGPPGPVPAAEA